MSLCNSIYITCYIYKNCIYVNNYNLVFHSFKFFGKIILQQRLTSTVNCFSKAAGLLNQNLILV